MVARDDHDYEDLLVRVKRGDPEAEQRLVNTFWRGVVAILYRQTRDQELSRDLAQETLMLVLTKARSGEIREPAALKTYIRKVSENKLIGFRRKESRQRTDTSSDYIESLESSQASLITAVSMEDLRVYVRRILGELKNDRDRDILRRHYLIGEEKQAICSALRLTPSQADTVLHRARRRLKALVLQKESSREGASLSDFLILLICVAGYGVEPVSGETVVPRSVSEYVPQSHYFVWEQRGSTAGRLRGPQVGVGE